DADHQPFSIGRCSMDNPFAVLEQWVKEGRIRLAANAPDEAVESEVRDFPLELMPNDLSDSQLFEFAMKNVKSLGWSSVPLHNRPPVEIQTQDEEPDALRALEDFFRNGRIELENTPEYIERSVQPHGRLYLDDLRSGRFSV